MAYYDGSLIFDTKIDRTGFDGGLKGIISVGAKAMTAFTAMLGVGSAAALKVGADFEEGMSQVAAVSGATGAELEALTAKAEEMGAKTKFSAAESAEALNYMAMAGWKTTEMLGGLEGIMNLAAASGEELGLVSDIVTDSMTAFGLAAADSAHFADVLAAASSSSNTNVSMMGATFKYVAPIAGAMRYSIEDTAVAIGLMANAGIKGEQAGTSLRAMLTRLADPPKEAADAMRTLGLSVSNADGTMRPFVEVLEQLRTKFSGLSDSQKASMASALAGTEAMSGLLAIVNAGQADFDGLAASIANANGTALQMAETMQDNLKGQITILSSGLESLGIAAYDKFAEPLKEAVKSAIGSVETLTASMTKGRLGGSMVSLGKSLGSVVETVTALAEKCLPPVVELLAIVLDHAKEILAVTMAVAGAKAFTAAFISLKKLEAAWKKASIAAMQYSVSQKVASASTAAGGLALRTGLIPVAGAATASVQGLTIAQWAFNAALQAMGGPIGLAVAAIGALAGVVAVYALTSKKQISETELLTEKVREQSKAYRELYDQQQEQIAEGVAELDHTRRLWRELETLVDRTGKVIGSKERALYIAEQINKIAPDTIKWIDGERIAYKDSAQALEDLLQKKRAQIILDSQEPLYREAVLNLREKENEQAELAILLAEKQLEIERVQQLKIDQNNKNGMLFTLRTQMGEIAKLYNANEGIIKAYYNNIAVYEANAAAIASDNYDQIKAINSLAGESFKYATNATLEELRRQSDNAAIHMAQMQERFDAGYKGVTQNMVDEAKRMFVLADSEFRKVATSSVDGYVAGINSSKARTNGTMRDWAKGILQSVKDTLGLHSPSRVFRDEIGKNLALGLGEGFADTMPDVYRRMQAAIATQTSRLSAGVTVAAGYVQQASQPAMQTAGETSTSINNTISIDAGKLSDVNRLLNIMDGERRSRRQGYIGR